MENHKLPFIIPALPIRSHLLKPNASLHAYKHHLKDSEWGCCQRHRIQHHIYLRSKKLVTPQLGWTHFQHRAMLQSAQ